LIIDLEDISAPGPARLCILIEHENESLFNILNAREGGIEVLTSKRFSIVTGTLQVFRSVLKIVSDGLKRVRGVSLLLLCCETAIGREHDARKIAAEILTAVVAGALKRSDGTDLTLESLFIRHVGRDGGGQGLRYDGSGVARVVVDLTLSVDGVRGRMVARDAKKEETETNATPSVLELTTLCKVMVLMLEERFSIFDRLCTEIVDLLAFGER